MKKPQFVYIKVFNFEELNASNSFIIKYINKVDIIINHKFLTLNNYYY